MLCLVEWLDMDRLDALGLIWAPKQIIVILDWDNYNLRGYIKLKIYSVEIFIQEKLLVALCRLLVLQYCAFVNLK